MYRSAAKRLDGALGSIDRVELDAKDQAHSIMEGIDMDDVANTTEPLGDVLGLLGDVVEVVGSELPDSVLRVGVDEHGQEDLAFERLNVADVLGHGAGEVIHGGVVGGETGLDEEVPGFDSIGKAIVSNKDSGVRLLEEDGRVLEAVVLKEVSVKHVGGRGRHLHASSGSEQGISSARHHDRPRRRGTERRRR